MSTLYFLMLLLSSSTGLIDLLLLSPSYSSMSSSLPPVGKILLTFDFMPYDEGPWTVAYEFESIEDDISAFDFLSPGFSILLWYALGGRLVSF